MHPRFSHLLLVAYLLVVGRDVAGSNSEPEWIPQSRVLSVPIPTNGDPILVPIQMNGVQRTFILDTGATNSLVSLNDIPKNASSIGPQQVKSRGSTIVAQLFKIDGIQLGNCDCNWMSVVAALDLSRLSRQLGHQVDGIIGMDVLSRFKLHFDFDSHKLIVFTGHDIPPGLKIPLRIGKNLLPSVECTVNNSGSMDFLIDTGALSTVEVDPELYGQLRREPSTKATGVVKMTIDVTGKPLEAEQIRCDSLRLGSFSHRSLVFGLAAKRTVGLYFLWRYRVTFDFPHSVAYWEPSKAHLRTDRSDGWGCCTETGSDGSKLVWFTTKNGLADRAGIRKEDKITAVNGVSTATMPQPVWDRLRTFAVGESLELVIEREGKPYTIRIPAE